MDDLSQLEFDVLDKLLAGEDPIVIALRKQLRVARVKSRELTGVGFYTEIELPRDVEPAPMRSGAVKFGDVVADVPGLRGGVGFLLFICDGRIEMLEGYTYEEPWPSQIDSYRLKYATTERRAAKKALGLAPN